MSTHGVDATRPLRAGLFYWRGPPDRGHSKDLMGSNLIAPISWPSANRRSERAVLRTADIPETKWGPISVSDFLPLAPVAGANRHAILARSLGCSGPRGARGPEDRANT
jgi:hypothetical protein